MYKVTLKDGTIWTSPKGSSVAHSRMCVMYALNVGSNEIESIKKIA